MNPEDIDREIKKLQKELQKLRAMKKFMEETDCPPCDFAVASSMVTQCYDNIKKGEEMREKFLRGEISFKQLVRGMNKNKKGCKYIYDFVRQKFKDVMDTRFDEWEY